MNLALFTDVVNANLLESVLRKYSHDIKVLYVFDILKPEHVPYGIYFFDSHANKDYHFLEEHCIDYAIVYGWGYKIPKDIVNKIPFFNVHPSFLPKYRGPIPIVFQLLNGEEKSGVTIHKMNENFDAGDIYKQKEFAMMKDESVDTLNIKITRCAFRLIMDLLSDMVQLNISLYQQDESQATYYSYKDLDKYIISSSIPYHKFKRIYQTLNGLYPVKAVYNAEVVEVASFSEKDAIGCIQYNLSDKTIFIKIKK